MNKNGLVVLLAVVLVLGGVLIAKSLNSSTQKEWQATEGKSTAITSLASEENDAMADYQAALAANKPIYVLFHSLTCQPCVEISAIVDEVLPSYGDRVTFVNAITDSPSGRELSSLFSFQYIPTSFFLSPDGTVLDSYTGVLSEDEMKARLDALAAE